ncbi:GSCOCT00013847001.3-RA-CDS, partial [Cotesia congregata]
MNFEEPYYKLPRNFARSIGCWPYQSRLESFLIGLFIVLAFTLQVGPIITAIVVHFDDRELILETIAPILTDIASFTVFVNSLINSKMVSSNFNVIKADWKLVANREEKLILEKYVELGNLMAAGYAGFVYLATVTFITEPVVPIIINLMLKTNLSAPHKLSVPMEWVVIDREKYYWILISYSGVCITVILTVLTAYDVLFITVVHHACGLFAVTGHRIQNLTSDEHFQNNTEKKIFLSSKKSHYEHLVSCIEIHRRALEYVDMIERTVTGCFGIVVLLNLPLISVTGMITLDNTLQQKIKNLMFTMGQVIHLFFECFLSQQLTDMSQQIHDQITAQKWYNIDVKSQKLLIIMIMRSQTPCMLTAGKIMGLSIETFGMLKTSGSYFTMLLSMQ